MDVWGAELMEKYKYLLIGVNHLVALVYSSQLGGTFVPDCVIYWFCITVCLEGLLDPFTDFDDIFSKIFFKSFNMFCHKQPRG